MHTTTIANKADANNVMSFLIPGNKLYLLTICFTVSNLVCFTLPIFHIIKVE